MRAHARVSRRERAHGRQDTRRLQHLRSARDRARSRSERTLRVRRSRNGGRGFAAQQPRGVRPHQVQAPHTRRRIEAHAGDFAIRTHAENADLRCADRNGRAHVARRRDRPRARGEGSRYPVLPRNGIDDGHGTRRRRSRRAAVVPALHVARQVDVAQARGARKSGRVRSPGRHRGRRRIAQSRIQPA